MTLPAASASTGGAPSFKRVLLWLGVAIVFLSTILSAPIWISWLGAILVMIGIYYIFREWFKQGRKATVAITVGLIGVIVIGVVLYFTFAIRSDVAQLIDEQQQIDREVEAMISQMSPNPTTDIAWYYDIESCRALLFGPRSFSLGEVGFDARSIIEGVNKDCQLNNDTLLICNRDSFLASKLRGYLEVIS